MTVKYRGRRPRPESAAHQPINPEPILAVDEHGWPRPWHDLVDWSRRPDLCYRKGYEDGVAAERARQAAEDDRVHRTAVQRLVRHLDVVENRKRAAA